MRKSYLLILIFAYLPFILFSQDRYDLGKISNFGKLWGIINHFHPNIPYGKINTDSLFLKNIDLLCTNPTNENYKMAISNMLKDLGDSYTHIINNNPEQKKYSFNDKLKNIYEIRDSVITFTPDFNLAYRNEVNSFMEFDSCYHKLDSYKYIIIDLRRLNDEFSDENKYYIKEFVNYLFSAFTNYPLYLPATRTRVHFGYEPEWFSSEGYTKGWINKNGNVINPNSIYRFVNKKICIIIDNNNSFLSGSISGIQYSKSAKILAIGDLDLFEDNEYYYFNIDDETTVKIRLSENVYPEGNNKFIPDQIDYTGNQEVIYSKCQKLFNQINNKPSKNAKTIQNYFVNTPNYPYGEYTFPPLNLRLLALMKYWNIIYYFNPNNELFKKNWDSVLVEFIPKFVNAKNADEYVETVAELISQINDSHAIFNNLFFFEKRRYYPGIKIGFIEDKTIITAITDENIIRTKELSVGDIITKINDIDIDSERKYLAKFISASNNSSLNLFINDNLLGGIKDSKIKIEVVHNGKNEIFMLKRDIEKSEIIKQEFTGNKVWNKINDNVGYVNLGLLSKDLVDSMYKDLSDTKAIIFDNRGYPMGTARDIVSHLTNKKFCEATFLTKIVISPDVNNNTNMIYKQETTLENKPFYNGQILILVNEQTQSQAEFLCLVLKEGAGDKVKIIGSQTSGAIGTVSGIILPGGISTFFTCQKVCDINGKNIQGTGIIPDIIVHPTIEGICKEKDELLLKAIEYANSIKNYE